MSRIGLNAILVAVDYTDLLRLTLPYNRHHFDQMLVVTSKPAEGELLCLCEEQKVGVFTTDAFYRGGARFNKWLALEEGLDVLGRSGWLCVMDADVLWPKDVVVQGIEGTDTLFIKTKEAPGLPLLPHQLCTPFRRMFPNIPHVVPDERTWGNFPIHSNTGEFAGYTQMFHASCPVLGHAPWHQTDWVHAGGADTFFQARWKTKDKVRPPFEVLHLGESGKNWCGRASAYADGSEPEKGKERLAELTRMMRQRRTRPIGKRYDHEKLSPP